MLCCPSRNPDSPSPNAIPDRQQQTRGLVDEMDRLSLEEILVFNPAKKEPEPAKPRQPVELIEWMAMYAMAHDPTLSWEEALEEIGYREE